MIITLLFCNNSIRYWAPSSPIRL